MRSQNPSAFVPLTHHTNPSYWRIVKSMIKKQFLIKIRSVSTIIEFVVALLLPFIIYIVEVYTTTINPEILNPQFDNVSAVGTNLAIFLQATGKSTFIVLPENNRTRELVKTVFEPYYGQFNFKVEFQNTTEEMENRIYATQNNGIAIYWANSDKEDAVRNPDLRIYMQSVFGTPTRDLFVILRSALANQQFKYSLAMMDVSFKPYARPQVTQTYDISLPIMIYLLLPIVLSTMPDFQTILDEKDTKVAALSLLMGCPESAYWLVSFIVPAILSLVPYIITSLMLAYLSATVGSSFSLILTFSFVFIIAHIFFCFLIMSFMKNSKQGRALVVVMVIMIVFFGYLHRFFTLDTNNTSNYLKHVFSIVPLSAYQLSLASIYNSYRTYMEPIKWKHFNAELTYPLKWGMYWLLIDCLIYFLLFMLFNATNKRQFGSPPLSWKDLFSVGAWKQLIQSQTKQTGQSGESAISVKNLSKIYYGHSVHKALDDVEFDINEGEVIVVIGPNGAGKSTMINIVTGAIEPTSGRLRIFGGPETTRFLEIQKYIGVCFQENVMVLNLTVREHFYLFGTFRGLNDEEISQQITVFCSTLQMDHMINNFSRDLSGGQKRKLCIALSLLGNPPIVVMDEPTAGVDVQSRQTIWRTIAGLEHTTTIVTSHALEEAETVCSRLFIMSKGRLAFSGSPNELRKEYKCGYLLRVDLQNNSINNVLRFVQDMIPDAHILAERDDTISLPVVEEIPQFFKRFVQEKESLGVISYSFTVEQIEDMLIKMIQTDEAAFQRADAE